MLVVECLWYVVVMISGMLDNGELVYIMVLIGVVIVYDEDVDFEMLFKCVD